MHQTADRPVLEIDNLAFSYTDCEPSLENVNLSLRSGDFLAVIGPNGGGKTTLLRLILGLLKPQKGHLAIFGASPASRNGNIGYVPQFSTLQTDFPATVLDMVLMGSASPSLFGGNWSRGGVAKKRALSYLDTLGLGACAGVPVGSLSGGQRQRALVARALMSKPEETQNGPSPFLLLLDEPTASIDPQGKFCFYEFLGNLRGSVTVIVVSHDLFMVSPFFNTIAFVNKTLTRFEGNTLTPETITLLFGQHLHDCPVADLQHAGGVMHDVGCSHPVCSGQEGNPHTTDTSVCCEGGCSHIHPLYPVVPGTHPPGTINRLPVKEKREQERHSDNGNGGRNLWKK